MRKLIKKTVIITAAAIILLSGGCDSYKKTDFAPDAKFVQADMKKL